MIEIWDKIIDEYKERLKELLNARRYDYKTVAKREIPNKSGIYVILDKEEALLYIGQSKRIRGRLIDDHLQNDKKGSAFRRNLSEFYHFEAEKEISQYIKNNCSFKYLELDKPKFVEHFANSVLKPKLNK